MLYSKQTDPLGPSPYVFLVFFCAPWDEKPTINNINNQHASSLSIMRRRGQVMPGLSYRPANIKWRCPVERYTIHGELSA